VSGDADARSPPAREPWAARVNGQRISREALVPVDYWNESDAQHQRLAHVILQELVATASSPQDAEKARKLAADVEEFLKKQPQKKS